MAQRPPNTHWLKAFIDSCRPSDIIANIYAEQSRQPRYAKYGFRTSWPADSAFHASQEYEYFFDEQALPQPPYFQHTLLREYTQASLTR